ncbi:outer membrane lipoprotein [Sapientia aquatica]|uniref:Glycine zipper 2TM domain-containing protein n=1 Tax=Sapientia aquatica TaxID=1549640 RepID=A0A4R5VWF1_9BURK|nr:glycine zipper 2TM domain-containing protein [Sapientia aquatica]TDK63506.1 glycine zipper 2TM domain-containing protein [Sapientia aquatica]
MKKVLAIAGLATIIALTGCAVTPNSANVYQARQTQGEQSVRMGVVESVRNVLIDKGQSGVGTLGGAALGGLAGSTVGKGNGSVAAAIGGAIAGGLIGQHVEQNMNNKPGLEITVKLDNGNLAAITQDADEAFNVGDRVRLLSDGRTTRVTH